MPRAASPRAAARAAPRPTRGLGRRGRPGRPRARRRAPARRPRGGRRPPRPRPPAARAAPPRSRRARSGPPRIFTCWSARPPGIPASRPGATARGLARPVEPRARPGAAQWIKERMPPRSARAAPGSRAPELGPVRKISPTAPAATRRKSGLAGAATWVRAIGRPMSSGRSSASSGSDPSRGRHDLHAPAQAHNCCSPGKAARPAARPAAGRRR